MKYFWNIGLVLLSFQGIGQDSKFQVELDTQTIQIGEQVRLVMELLTPAQNAVQWPSFPDTISGLELLESSAIDSGFDEADIGTRILRQEHLLTSFDSGYYVIPPIYAGINDSFVKSQARLLKVQTVPLDSNLVMRDIKSPMEVDYGFLDWLAIYWTDVLMVLFGIGAIGILIHFLMRTKEEVLDDKPKEPEIPAHVIAMEKLDALQVKKLWQEGQIKEYYSELSEIVREFIELRFGIIALELTTPEILGELKDSVLKDASFKLLKDLLPLADMAKFAKFKPLGEENEQAIQHARQFVELNVQRKEVEDV
jgi:hypothetical protein